MFKIVLTLILLVIVCCGALILYQELLGNKVGNIISNISNTFDGDAYVVIKTETIHDTVFIPQIIYLPGEIDTVYIDSTGTFEKWARTVYDPPEDKNIFGKMYINYNITENEYVLDDSLYTIKTSEILEVAKKEKLLSFGIGVDTIGSFDNGIFGLHVGARVKNKFDVHFGGVSIKKISLSGTYWFD